jgi:hypothetical protein
MISAATTSGCVGACAVHTVLVLRRSGSAVICLLAACVGTNPRWDRPDDDIPKNAEESTGGAADGSTDVGGDGSDDDGETGASEGDVSSGSSGATDEGSSSAGPMTDATTEGDEPPSCEAGHAICAGECTDTATDKHACGVECIDCTIRYGNMARCRDGVCGPKDEDED